MSRKPAEFAGYPGHLAAAAPYGPYRAAITYVTDGDTVDVLLDLGFSHYTYMSVRIAGIDAPKLFSGPPAERADGARAKNYVETLVATRGPHCVVYSEKWPQSFGRYVATIRLADGTDLAEAIVDAGHAVWSQR